MLNRSGLEIVLKSIKFYYTSYLPETYRHILEINIPIISANDLFSATYPNEVKEWKEKTFKLLPEKFNINKNIPTNMVCIGDSPLELDAAHTLSR